MAKFDPNKNYRKGKSKRFGKGSHGRHKSKKFSDGPKKRGDRFTRDSHAEMHEIRCDECGRRSEVPFKPTTSKPILCGECFKGVSKKSSGNSSNALQEINRKLDKIMKALDIK